MYFPEFLKKIDTGISKGQIQPTCSNCIMFKARQKHNYIIIVILDDHLSIGCLFLKLGVYLAHRANE